MTNRATLTAAQSDRAVTFDPSWNTAPPSYTTRVSVVLGAEDLTYRTSTSLAALGPLLINNRIHTPGIGFYHSPSGNVDLRILPQVTHDSHEQLVFDNLAASMAMWPES